LSEISTEYNKKSGKKDNGLNEKLIQLFELVYVPEYEMLDDNGESITKNDKPVQEFMDYVMIFIPECKLICKGKSFCYKTLTNQNKIKMIRLFGKLDFGTFEGFKSTDIEIHFTSKNGYYEKEQPTKDFIVTHNLLKGYCHIFDTKCNLVRIRDLNTDAIIELNLSKY